MGRFFLSDDYQTINRSVKSFAEQILNYIFPPKCGFCGEITGTESFICEKCEILKRQEYENRCKYCGKITYNEVCPECNKQKLYYEQLFFCCEYTEELKEKIHAYKFFGKKYYFHFFSEMLLNNLFNTDADVIIPVPISRERRKERGYNQTELIAKRISSCLGIKYDDKVLYKSTDVERQSLLDAAKRKKSVKDIFKIADILRVRGKSIILVDDIFATGATANECSKALMRAGAKNVKIAVICISHTLK